MLRNIRMNTSGYIYLLRCERTHLVKIGFSKDPRRRVRELTRQSTLLPYEHLFRLFDAFKGTLREEQRLHGVFSHLRRRGEWFDLCFWRYMDILYAFDARERLQGIPWEGRNTAHTNPFSQLSCAQTCKCDVCDFEGYV